MRINTNVSALNARNNLRNAQADMEKAMERLSSGLRINGASDDAAGLAISERLEAQTRGMEQAYANAQDGISMIQTADGSMGVISDILQRARELAVQADNGTYSDADKASIQNEIGQLLEEIDHIAQNSSFNGINLLADAKDVKLHVSEKATDIITVSTVKSDSEGLGVDGIDVTADAQAAITAIDGALDTLSEARAGLGAAQNRLDFISQNLATTQTNTEASNSQIADADMAAEMSELTRAQTLQSTTMAMLTKANSQPQQVQQLLQG